MQSDDPELEVVKQRHRNNETMPSQIHGKGPVITSDVRIVNVTPEGERWRIDYEPIASTNLELF